METIRCPRCHKDFVRPTSGSEGWGKVLDAAHLHRFHCQLCGYLFRAFHWADLPVQEKQADRRAHERISTRFAARVFWPHGEGDGQVTDLSLGGCTIETEASIVEGDLLRIELRPDGEPTAVVVEAAVVRHAGPWRLGIQFLRLNDKEGERLRTALQGLARPLKEAPTRAFPPGGGPGLPANQA